MKTQIYVLGAGLIPKQLKKKPEFQCHLVKSAYDLKDKLGQTPGEKIIVVFLSFLEVRHFDIYSYLQNNYSNVKTFFLVDELSANMKIRLKTNDDFIVLWRTEEQHLARDISSYLEGKKLYLREDRRDKTSQSAILAQSTLPLGVSNQDFKIQLTGAHIENISNNGTRLKIRASPYKKKDFVKISYQNKQGEYVDVEAQVRWTEKTSEPEIQEIGLQFLTYP